MTKVVALSGNLVDAYDSSKGVNEAAFHEKHSINDIIRA